jgi:hypothetical protein
MESPDFQYLGRQAAESITGGMSVTTLTAYLAEQYRCLWNARGAADGAAVKAELQRALDAGPQPARVTINLEQVIKALDQ